MHELLIIVIWFQVKTKRLLESKTEALEAQQDAGSSKQALEELQFTCAKLTEVSV